jgi:hypothetical protein
VCSALPAWLRGVLEVDRDGVDGVELPCGGARDQVAGLVVGQGGPGLSSSVLLILAVVSPGGVLVVAGAGLEAAVEASDEAVRIIAKANVA